MVSSWEELKAVFIDATIDADRSAALGSRRTRCYGGVKATGRIGDRPSRAVSRVSTDVIQCGYAKPSA